MNAPFLWIIMTIAGVVKMVMIADMFELDTNTRIKILSEYLEEDIEDFEVCDYDAQIIEFYNSEYLVLTDIEADNRASDVIRDSLFSFHDWFLHGHVKDPNVEVEHIRKVLELYEDANPILEALIGDIEHFVEDAVMSDGRGHFLSGYDGDEEEIEYACPDCGNKKHYVYIYRVN